jgi:eukaryotic-like serine/threonine-protein kinase
VAAAHARGVIHRDLKPSNVLLAPPSPDGAHDWERLQVADFGLAKRLDGGDPALTGTADSLGTPGYMPPEQVSRANGPVDCRADVYGLGATLFHLLTGRAPFAGDTALDTIQRVLGEAPPRPRALNPRVPPGLEAVVLKCLAKDPGDRYPTVEAFLADLEAAGRGEQGAPEMTPARRLGLWAVRHRRALGAGAAVLLVAAGAFALGNALRLLAPVPKGADPLAEQQRELTAGRPVVLIGERGKPAWHRWAVGGPELIDSPTGDGACAYEANGYTLLDLCPDPLTDRFLVRAKVQYVQTKLGEAVGPPLGTTNAGLYVGRRETPGAAGWSAHTMLAVTFSDNPRRLPQVRPGDPPIPRPLKLRDLVLYLKPDGDQTDGTVGGPWLEIGRPDKLPGPWRALEIEVTPDRVRAWCDNAKGERTQFADLSADELRALRDQQRKNYDQTVGAAAGVTLPDWSPRGAIGIWNMRSTIAVKDVSVAPLK